MLDLPYTYTQSGDTFKHMRENRNRFMEPSVTLISGCKDNQLSEEFVVDMRVGGLLTVAFLRAIESTTNCFGIFNYISKYIGSKGSEQTPVLSTSRLLNNTSTFL